MQDMAQTMAHPMAVAARPRSRASPGLASARPVSALSPWEDVEAEVLPEPAPVRSCPPSPGTVAHVAASSASAASLLPLPVSLLPTHHPSRAVQAATASGCWGAAWLLSTVVEPWWHLHITNDSRVLQAEMASLRRARRERRPSQARARAARERAVSGSSGSSGSDTDSDDASPVAMLELDLGVPTNAGPGASGAVAAAKASRGHRIVPGLLARLLLAMACIVPWVSFHHDDQGVVPPGLRTVLAWTGLVNAGYAYVSVVISKRVHLFRGRHGGYRDFIVVNMVSPLLYICGVGRYENLLWGVSPNELGSTPAPYVAFVLPYCLGLHLSYLARACKPCGRSLSMRELEQCGWSAIVSYMGKFLLMVGLVVLHLHHLYVVGTLAAVLPYYMCAAVALAWCTYAVRRSHYLHLHHWFMGCLLTPLCHVASPMLSLVNLGLCVAQFVEGASKWSCAPLWHARDGVGIMPGHAART